MDAPNLRPRLNSFRLLAFSGANNTPDLIGHHIGFEMTPAIEMALGIPVPPVTLLRVWSEFKHSNGRQCYMTNRAATPVP